MCFYIAGESDRPAHKSDVIPEAHFKHPMIQETNRQCFGRGVRTPAITRQIKEIWTLDKST